VVLSTVAVREIGVVNGGVKFDLQKRRHDREDGGFGLVAERALPAMATKLRMAMTVTTTRSSPHRVSPLYAREGVGSGVSNGRDHAPPPPAEMQA